MSARIVVLLIGVVIVGYLFCRDSVIVKLPDLSMAQVLDGIERFTESNKVARSEDIVYIQCAQRNICGRASYLSSARYIHRG